MLDALEFGYSVTHVAKPEGLQMLSVPFADETDETDDHRQEPQRLWQINLRRHHGHRLRSLSRGLWVPGVLARANTQWRRPRE
jgi:hypothetical protein